VAVSGVEPTSVDLREPSEPLGLERLDCPMDLLEVLLEPRVGEVRKRLDPERLDRRP
jgi:hypothetical protein